jgi:hypothetical protein
MVRSLVFVGLGRTVISQLLVMTGKNGSAIAVLVVQTRSVMMVEMVIPISPFTTFGEVKADSLTRSGGADRSLRLISMPKH